jgi:hypothetical protein
MCVACIIGNNQNSVAFRRGSRLSGMDSNSPLWLWQTPSTSLWHFVFCRMSHLSVDNTNTFLEASVGEEQSGVCEIANIAVG